MSKVILFEEFARDSMDFKKSNETLFNFLNRSGRNGYSTIRSDMNSLFSLVPEEKEQEVLSRIKNDRSFDGVFYELFLLGLFSNLGFNIEVEPQSERNSKLPDFQITKHESKIIVEATSNPASLTSKIRNLNIRHQITEELNSLDLDGIRLLVCDLSVFVDQKPSIKTLKLQLIEHSKMLRKRGYPLSSVIESENDESPIFRYEDKNISFTTFFYNDNHANAQLRGTIAGDSFDIGIDRTIQEITKSVNKKKSKYGEFKQPYVICVNFPYMHLDEQEIFYLLGLIEGRKGNNHEKRFNFSALIDKSISGIYISFVTPFNIREPKYWFFHNPHSKYPIPDNLFPIDAYKWGNGQFVFLPCQSKNQIQLK